MKSLEDFTFCHPKIRTAGRLLLLGGVAGCAPGPLGKDFSFKIDQGRF